MTANQQRAAHRGHVLTLEENRVWRTYPGGATLDRLAGKQAPVDSHFAEDWIGSCTAAVSPGREHIEEGLSRIDLDGHPVELRTLFESDPLYFFGERHTARFGPHPMMLVKFLDSAIRLHVQAHPSRAFARTRLGTASGKTEAYCVLGIRDHIAEPYIHIGFQHPPTRDRLREIITGQDTRALEGCFEKIPVRIGDVFLVPGGMPHALGEGLFLIEIQEPTDMVVRLEFERGGYTLPEAARFMGRDIEFALDLMDLSAHPVSEITSRCGCHGHNRRALGESSWQEDLIGPEQTPCFRLRRTSIGSRITKHESEFHLAIVTKGTCRVSTAMAETLLQPFAKIAVPAGLGPVTFAPETRTEIVECFPPEPS